MTLFARLCSVSGIDDLRFGAGTFNGLHPLGSIGSSTSYSLILSGRGGNPSKLVSTMTHEEGHGLGMKHDKKSK